MKIYFDENMPFAEAFFSPLGEAKPFAGRQVSSSEIRDADVLLVRSITQVNQQLIDECENLSFVGSATIGFDHIDLDYLAERKIPFYSAPGCNAVSVADYVISALSVLSDRMDFDLRSKTVAIIGAGNTGSRVQEKLDALGVNYLLCDPFLAKTDTRRSYVSVEEALKADVISLHVPKTLNGPHPTYHLLDRERLSQLRQDQILINACRGEVIDNQALLELKKDGHNLALVLDVWENEPHILTELIDYTEIATAHIAGYSLEGKSRGTEMLYQALCKEKGITAEQSLSAHLPTFAFEEISINSIDFNELKSLMRLVYDVRRDDAIFRSKLQSIGFDMLRKTYPIRRENSAISVKTRNEDVRNLLSPLGFNVLP